MTKSALREPATANPSHSHVSLHGYGGALASPWQLYAMWKRARSQYGKHLGEIRNELVDYVSEFPETGEHTVIQVLKNGGTPAMAVLLNSEMKHLTGEQLRTHLISDTVLVDPFIGFRAQRLGRAGLVWDSRCGLERIEDSPLFESIATAAESQAWAAGNGAVHILDRGTDAPSVFWQAGDGAVAAGMSTAHTYR